MREWLCCNFAAGSFYTKKLSTRLYSTEVDFWSKKQKSLFEPPSLDLGVTHALHLYLVEKPVVDFIFLIIMAVLYVSRGKTFMFYGCTLFFFFFFCFFFVSKGNLRGYWIDSIHTFTQYPVLVQFNIAPTKVSKSLPPQKNHPKPLKNWHLGDRVRH